MGQNNSTSNISYEGTPINILLSHHVLLKIFQYLSPGELCFDIAPVCKIFATLTSNDILWERFMNEKYKSEKNLKQLYISWVRRQTKLGLEDKVNLFYLSGYTDPITYINHFRFTFYLTGTEHGGKTTLVRTLTHRDPESTSTSTRFEGFSPNCEARVLLFVFSEASKRNEEMIIQQNYKNIHAIMLCFDITDLDSYEKSKTKLTEVSKCVVGGVVMVAVGTKTDSLENQRKVQQSEAKNYFSKLV